MYNEPENKYQLIAHNEQGASVCYWGDTIKSVLEQFDANYFRKGFHIVIYKCGYDKYETSNGTPCNCIEIKKTYR